MINNFIIKIKKLLKKIEFNSFLIAIKNKELSIKEKKQLKINIGQNLEKILRKKVDFKNPDILIEINLKEKKINYQIKPLYIYGRYQKIKPGIPQTKWHKKRYQTSVQEEIGDIILKYTKGDNHSFHGCGREDIDVLMLGNGRPFVLEIKNPKIRKINLKEIQKEINKTSLLVKVSNLEFTTKEKIKQLKQVKPDKIYQAIVQLEKKTKKEELINTEKLLSNIVINQKTPIRVLKRRTDLTRNKKIYYFKLIKFNSLTPTFEIKSQSGTYIKELISGDQGRTKPSLSEILNQKCYVKKLIVKKIEF